jgi:hypothetical protein
MAVVSGVMAASIRVGSMQQVLGVDVHEDRLAAFPEDGAGGGHVAEGRGDDLALDAQCPDGELDGKVPLAISRSRALRIAWRKVSSNSRWMGPLLVITWLA